MDHLSIGIFFVYLQRQNIMVQAGFSPCFIVRKPELCFDKMSAIM